MKAKDNKIVKLLTSETVGPALILIVIFAGLSISADGFLSFRNMINFWRYDAFYIMVVMGILVLFTAGTMDLSCSSTMCMGAMVAAAMAQRDLPLPLIILAVAVVGILIGSCIGFLIGTFNFPPFIATMGFKIAITGLTLVFTSGYPINDLSESFNKLGQNYLLGIPLPIWFAAVTVLVTWYLIHKTTLGRHIVATGGNPNAAIVSGINIKFIRIFTHSYSSMVAALTGMLLASRMGSGQLSIGTGYEMDVIAGVVIGGSSMGGGGIGSTLGAFCGMTIICVIKNGMDILGVNAYWQQVVQGLTILIAIGLDIIRKRANK